MPWKRVWTLRIDALEARLDMRIDSLQEEMNTRFDVIEIRMRENQAQIMTQFSTLINFSAITERLSRLEASARTHAPSEAAHQ